MEDRLKSMRRQIVRQAPSLVLRRCHRGRITPLATSRSIPCNVLEEDSPMRNFGIAVLVLIAAALGASFYFGLCTLAAERTDKIYVVRLEVHPDILAPKQADVSAQEKADENSLEAKGT